MAFADELRARAQIARKRRTDGLEQRRDFSSVTGAMPRARAPIEGATKGALIEFLARTLRRR